MSKQSTEQIKPFRTSLGSTQKLGMKTSPCQVSHTQLTREQIKVWQYNLQNSIQSILLDESRALPRLEEVRSEHRPRQRIDMYQRMWKCHTNFHIFPKKGLAQRSGTINGYSISAKSFISCKGQIAIRNASERGRLHDRYPYLSRDDYTLHLYLLVSPEDRKLLGAQM